jgi:hypothetical protein
LGQFRVAVLVRVLVRVLDVQTKSRLALVANILRRMWLDGGALERAYTSPPSPIF